MIRLLLWTLACGLFGGGIMAQTTANEQNPQTQDPQDQDPQQQPQDRQSTAPTQPQTQVRPAPIKPGKVAPMRPAKIAPVKPTKVVPIRPSPGRNVAPVPSIRRDIEVPFSPHQNTLSRYYGYADADGDGTSAVQHVPLDVEREPLDERSQRREPPSTDCDDGNPNRFAGNIETPDFNGNDEDCDPNTIGEMDRDGDGYIDYRVWNADFRYVGREKRGVYGDDCDDTNRAVNPGVPEIPYNGLDDNCDGDVDFDDSWPTRPPER